MTRRRKVVVEGPKAWIAVAEKAEPNWMLDIEPKHSRMPVKSPALPEPERPPPAAAC